MRIGLHNFKGDFYNSKFSCFYLETRILSIEDKKNRRGEDIYNVQILVSFIFEKYTKMILHQKACFHNRCDILRAPFSFKGSVSLTKASSFL